MENTMYLCTGMSTGLKKTAYVKVLILMSTYLFQWKTFRYFLNMLETVG